MFSLLQCQFTFFFLSTHEFQWVQAILSREEGGIGNHDKLSFFQVIIILLRLCQIVPQTQQSANPTPPPPRVLFIPFGSNQHFCISQPFQGCDDELQCFQSFPSEWLVVTSLNIFKDNAFHSHFHLTKSVDNYDRGG